MDRRRLLHLFPAALMSAIMPMRFRHAVAAHDAPMSLEAQIMAVSHPSDFMVDLGDTALWRTIQPNTFTVTDTAYVYSWTNNHFIGKEITFVCGDPSAFLSALDSWEPS